MPSSSANSSSDPIDPALLLSFRQKMKELIKVWVSAKVNEQLFKLLGMDFVNEESAEKRCDRLLLEEKNPLFTRLLQENGLVAYRILTHGVGNKISCIERLKKVSFGDEIIIPMELDDFHQQVCQNLKTNRVERSFSAWMYHNLGYDFFSLSPDDQCKKLGGLKFGQECEKQIAYKLLIYSTKNRADLIAFLRSKPIWKFVNSVESDLFHQRMLLTTPCDKTFSDTLFQHLGPDYLNQDPSEQLKQLKRASPEFVAFLKLHQVTADDFLRQSFEKYPELFAELKQGFLKECFIPQELKVFHQGMEALTRLSLPWEFTKKLSEYISADFLSEDSYVRYAELDRLCKGPKGPGFISLLNEHRIIADTFLRKYVNEIPALVQRLHNHSHLQGFLLRDRKVRKRNSDFFPGLPAGGETEEASRANKKCSFALSPFGSGET